MKPPRVLQAIAGRPHGGAEVFFVRLTAALARAGVEQRIVIRCDAGRAAALRAAGVAPAELGFRGIFDLATRLALAGEIRRFRPRIVFTWMNRATMLMPPRWLAGGDFVHAARLGGYYDLKYYRGCDHLVGNTRDIVAYIRQSGWPEERVHYLPNFADISPAPPVDRRTLDTPPDAPVALALGRLHPNKAFDVLLDALARAPSVYLWLAGEGDERARLEAQARRLGIGGRVRFLGWRDDAAALFAASDMLVCPSRHEPLGNVVIEAWGRGVPVAAAASEGPADLIADGVSGLLVPVDDANALATAIQRLADDKALRSRLAAGGRAAYAAEFTEEAVVGRYMRFFAEVAA
ncbi:MAG: glycosyltransferase [Rhodospirillales bacterium]|nr:glycosyltransferase [Rhodospirillales bacterium]